MLFTSAFYLYLSIRLTLVYRILLFQERYLFDVCVGPGRMVPYGWADAEGETDILVMVGTGKKNIANSFLVGPNYIHLEYTIFL